MTTACSSAVAPTAQKTALLVASGGDVDELLTNVLASDGWSIQRVADNQHILALARTKPFDLIVTGGKLASRRMLSFFAKSGVLVLTSASSSSPINLLRETSFLPCAREPSVILGSI